MLSGYFAQHGLPKLLIVNISTPSTASTLSTFFTMQNLAPPPAAHFHPRLGTPMRLIDLAFFVAEHDDHHLAQITHLANLR